MPKVTHDRPLFFPVSSTPASSSADVRSTRDLVREAPLRQSAIAEDERPHSVATLSPFRRVNRLGQGATAPDPLATPIEPVESRRGLEPTPAPPASVPATRRVGLERRGSSRESLTTRMLLGASGLPRLPTRPRSTRFAIIGAGPAGLSAAEALRAKGYDNVLVLERAPRVGGKCYSFEHEGLIYELGAVVGTPDDRLMRDIMRREGVVPAPLPVLSAFAERAPDLARVRSGRDMTSRPVSTALDALPLFVRSRIVGDARTRPQAEILRFLEPNTTRAFRKGAGFTFGTGAQGLWERVARHHDVRLSTRVIAVRRGSGIEVVTQDERLEVDELIFACPPEGVLDILDATKDEAALFRRIRSRDYRVFACFVDNLLPEVGFAPEAAAGRPIAWMNPHPERNLFMFYVRGDGPVGPLDDGEILENIVRDVAKRGGRFQGLHRARRWRHFPQISAREDVHGFFEAMAALQGARHTYYASEVLSASTLERSVNCAKNLVDRFF